MYIHHEFEGTKSKIFFCVVIGVKSLHTNYQDTVFITQLLNPILSRKNLIRKIVPWILP